MRLAATLVTSTSSTFFPATRLSTRVLNTGPGRGPHALPFSVTRALSLTAPRSSTAAPGFPVQSNSIV